MASNLDTFTKNGLTEEEQAAMDEFDAEQAKSEEEDKAVDMIDADPEEEEEEGEDKIEQDEIVSKDEIIEEPVFIPLATVDKLSIDAVTADLQKVASDLVALRKQLDEGEIEFSVYEEQKDILLEKRSDLKVTQAIAERDVRHNADVQSQLWAHDQKVFFEHTDNAVFNTNKILYGALDTAVKDLANDPVNTNRTGSWILNEAKRQVFELFKQHQKTEEKPENKPIVSKKDKVVPITLGNMPVSEANVTQDEFASIDKLLDKGDQYAYERALSKLTSEQQERYLQG
jgi:hypothetical protein